MSSFDDYTPSGMPRGTKIALVAIVGGLMAVFALVLLIAAKTAKEEGSQSSATTSETKAAAERDLPRPSLEQRIGDEVLATHPFWRKPLSKSQLRFILDRLKHEGRTRPLAVDDEARTVDDDRNEDYGVRFWTAQRDKQIGTRFISVPRRYGVSERAARQGLLEAMNAVVDRGRYDRKYNH